MDASNLLSYITTTNLADDNWKGPVHSFVLNWQDKVRLYNDLNPQLALLPILLLVLLQNAVHLITKLRQVKVMTAQMKTFAGQDLSYSEYCNLLNDKQNAGKGGKFVKRKIYEHGMYLH